MPTATTNKAKPGWSTRLAVFHPKLLDAVLNRNSGYTRAHFGRDVGAGLTVGVVALPLAMAFAIASGLKPEAGLFTAIIAGFLISALGGSRVQIGGPAGAFIVIVYGILERYGLANLIIATAMSGVLLFLMGLFKLGTLIRFIPISVVIGFTNGIAVLIMLSQVKDLLGLDIEKAPASFFALLRTLGGALDTLNPYALALGVGTLLMVVGWQRSVPQLLTKNSDVMPQDVKAQVHSSRVMFIGKLSAVPGTIVALTLATLAVWWLELPVETIGSKFGGIPAELPAFVWPDLNWDTARFLLVPALTLALLGAIESLLCARIADSFTEDRHDPNQELMAQGAANFVTPFFGGMPATGTIARTVTNAKSGAVSPVSGMVHAGTLLIVVLVAAPLASNIPLAALAGILLYVAWNMGEWREFVRLRQYRLPYRVTLLAVFSLTVIVDLTVAVEVGLIAACLTFIYRISSLTRAEPVRALAHPMLAGREHEVQAWRLYGALFFGAVRQIEEIERNVGAGVPAQALVLDMKNLLYVDSSGADALHDLRQTCEKHNVQLVLCGLNHQPLDIAVRSGLVAALPPDDICPDLSSGLNRVLQA